MVGEVDGMGRRRVGLDDVKVRMLKLSWTRSTTNLVVRETRATIMAMSRRGSRSWTT